MKIETYRFTMILLHKNWWGVAKLFYG